MGSRNMVKVQIFSYGGGANLEAGGSLSNGIYMHHDIDVGRYRPKTLPTMKDF